ncbi:Scr1 family TA system antitoxin-like transcriptional regulator [Kibdelosporangium aridum]|uniref:Scr1 family TA system antitoxin-like transcriptional regulator n=1 Tax=Kibdelosporangium aridum TaxID=2030 RepID=UPI0005258A7D
MAVKPTRRKRKLGRYMERLRRKIEPTAPTPEDVAKIVETARTTITRMELGQQLPQLHLFYAILGVYRATKDEREEATKLWRAAKQDTTVIEHAADLRPKYVAFRRDESEAVRERSINYVVLPGLLQTAGYASALADANNALRTAEAGWELRAAEERQVRQRLLSGPNPLHLHAILSEACLLYQVGGSTVMAEQLQHLLTVARKPNVTIQVVPFAAGAVGPMTSPVIILEFDDDPENPHSVYLEHAAGGESIDDQTDVSRFLALFDDVRASALSPAKSTDAIRAVLDKIEDTT